MSDQKFMRFVLVTILTIKYLLFNIPLRVEVDPELLFGMQE